MLTFNFAIAQRKIEQANSKSKILIQIHYAYLITNVVFFFMYEFYCSI